MIDAALAEQGMALIEVRSVYDTDGLNRMAEQMFTAADRPEGSARRLRRKCHDLPGRQSAAAPAEFAPVVQLHQGGDAADAKA